jgi:hypothetical protein
MADSATVKTSWADDVEVEELGPAKVEDYVDENGIRITVEYTVNDEGKKVKVRGYLDCGIRMDGLTLAVDVSRLRGRPSVHYRNRLSITPWPRENNGQSSERRKVPTAIVFFVMKIGADVCDRQQTWP